MRYKAISIKQPWANLIAQGTKTIETRKWATNYRGPLLICASQKAMSLEAYSRICRPAQVMERPAINLWPRGVALCLVDLLGCEVITREHSSARLEADACCLVHEGLVVWHLGRVRGLKPPLPEVKGSLRLFTVELDRVGLL